MQVEVHQVGGAAIRVYELGTEHPGPPLVLLHGGIADCARLSWLGGAGSFDLMKRFATERRVLALDFPGYGGSPPQASPSTLASYVHLLLDFLDKLQIERAVICGISMGGMAGLAFTLAHPERIAKLVLISTGGLTTRFPFQKLGFILTRHLRLYERMIGFQVRRRSMVRIGLQRMFYDQSLITERLIDEVMAELNRECDGPVRAFAEFGRDQLTWKGLRDVFQSRLAEIKAPVLVLHGDRDYFYPVSLAETAAAKLTDVKLIIYRNAGHWLTLEKPEGIAAAILEFCA